MLHQIFPNQSLFWRKFNYLHLLFYSQVQTILHLEDMISYIIGNFPQSTKDTFYQGNLHQDNVFKCKNDQKRNCIGHIEILKKSKITFKRWKLSKLWVVQVGKFWRNTWNAKCANMKFWTCDLTFWVSNMSMALWDTSKLTYILTCVLLLFYLYLFCFYSK